MDRWDRKRTMIVADAVRTLALASLAVALALDDFTFEQVVVAAILAVAALSAAVGLAASLSRSIRTAPRAEELLSSA